MMDLLIIEGAHKTLQLPINGFPTTNFQANDKFGMFLDSLFHGDHEIVNSEHKRHNGEKI